MPFRNSSSLLTNLRPYEMSSVEPLYDYQFRLILIGDSTVGKSCLLRAFTDGKFSELSDPTVGVDFFSRLVQVRDGRRIKLQLWDTAGQERFRSITKSYYRNSVGAILVFDITSKVSFGHLPAWLSEARTHIAPRHPVFLIIGSKADLNSLREVSPADLFNFSAAQGIHSIETSAKSGLNVNEAFQIITQDIYNRVTSGEFRVEEEDGAWDGIKIYNNNNSRRDLLEGESVQNNFCC